MSSTSADNIRNNLAESPDVDTDNTSRKLLEDQNDLAAFRKLMRGEPRWYYNEWKNSVARRGANNWADMWNESDEEKLEKLKSFQLWAIADLGMRVGDLHHAVGWIADGGDTARTSSEPVWEGDSGDAARESLTKFSKACTDAATSWEELGHVASTLCGDIKRSIEELIAYGSNGSTIDQYRGRYGNLNDSSEDDHLSNIRDLFAEVKDSGEISPGASPEDIADAIGTTWTYWEWDWPGFVKWIDDHNDAYSAAVEQYRDQVDETIQTIEGLLNTFGDSVGSPSYLADLNPLAAVRPAKDEKPGDDGGSDKGGDKGRDTGGTGSSGSPSTGSPSTGSPSTGSPSTGSPSSTAPADVGAPQRAEGTNPVTGKPLEIDPATGKPYPIDPSTGEPIKDVGDDQDTTTVKQGDKEISMTEPSKTGEMTVGVDDGKGGTKNYRLDFDPENPPQDGKEGKDGQSVGGGAAGYGPQGSGGKDAPGGKAGPEDEVHVPGEDGKIRIKDGDLEIVAEQPLGPDGATVVTVDDGTGEPTTQILGDKEDVDEYKRLLNEDQQRLTGYREDLEGRENVSKSEWDELRKAEDSFRERGGGLPDDDGKHAEKVSDGQPAGAEERSEPKSVFDEAEKESKSSGGLGKSAFDEAKAAGGGGAGASGFSGGGGGAAGGVGGSVADLEQGARSGVGAPPGSGGAGVAAAPGAGTGAEPAAASSGARGGAGGGMMGGGMMGGGMGAGGGGDEQRGGNSAYQVHGGLFEPEVDEGPFGVARISGSLNDEEA